MASSLAERARSILATLPEPDTLEGCLERAALQVVARHQDVAPDRSRLRELTTPSRVRANLASWPAELVQARLAALLHTGRLAIIDNDISWLREIDQAWQVMPANIDDVMAVLRARGELGLALGAWGSRPSGWDVEELIALSEEGLLRPDAPADEAWWALATGDVDRAARALERFREAVDAARSAWHDDEEAALRQIRAHPASVLDIEGRALDALIARQNGAR